MNTCQTHQTQLLHHLYGLLDALEQQALTAHLESCADCRAALDSARAQQQAITYAARGQFPGVRIVVHDEDRRAGQRQRIGRTRSPRRGAGCRMSG